ncbi:MAG: ATP-binding cassette domain-containing protein [Campylobacterales bacterium]|nr:ATP-binding cassette domain-containing protein [Campylobacterales bacterium]
MIQARDLTISYDNEVVLNKVAFNINPGDLVFISGKSGSGKSSLLKAIYGALKITDGSLLVNNVEMGKFQKGKIKKLRRSIGVIFQDYQLVEDWSIEKNIAMPLMIGSFNKKVIDTQVNNLLNHIKLAHKAHRLPNELSGGEQQRVGVARALAHSPNLILADEPTGNLDEYSADMVMSLFKSINELGKTVIIVTHKMPQNMNVNFKHFYIEDRGINEVF